MPKYEVQIAREETTMYYIEVEADNENDAEDRAWDQFNKGSSSILDYGNVVHANEYVDYVEEVQNA